VRRATFVLVGLVLGLGGCSDLRDFRGTWQGPRVGDAPALRVGVAAQTNASLTIDGIDTHGLRGTLTVDGLLDNASFVSLAGAEADVLAGMSFGGSPLRVYLTFVPVPDSAGEALALIALYNDHRIEVRILRGGQTPIYAIFALAQAP
jgi:hypothetical protein